MSIPSRARTLRPDGTRQTFEFLAAYDYLESSEEIPEPHAFTARLHLDGHAGVEIQEVEFEELGGARTHNTKSGVAHYMGSRDLSRFLEAQNAAFRAILTELGLAR